MNELKYICNIKPPMKCEHHVDGKLSQVNMCGGNPLKGEVFECPMREKVRITSVEDGAAALYVGEAGLPEQ